MPPETATEILTFDDLAPFLLLKNGNYLYKVPFRDGWAVLKVYYDSRTPFERLRKSLNNLLTGQTSYLPRTRLRVERDCVRLWRQHGFRVFEIYDRVEVRAPDCPKGGYQLFEYVEAPKLIDILRDEDRDADERFAIYRGFLEEWSRRHELAISLGEPRLVHENGDSKHVLILDDAFLWFDFEMVYRHPAKVRYYVAHEILQYIWQVLRNLSAEDGQRLIDETIEHYPVRERLASVYEYFFENPDWWPRFVRMLDRRFSRRAAKPTSKYNVARRIRERLAMR